MKKFAGNKKLEVIQEQCESAGIHYDDRALDHGFDHVVITTIKGDRNSGQVIYNSVNGNFFGVTHEGVKFNSNETEHEHEPWFQALLSFFYVEKAAA